MTFQSTSEQLDRQTKSLGTVSGNEADKKRKYGDSRGLLKTVQFVSHEDPQTVSVNSNILFAVASCGSEEARRFGEASSPRKKTKQETLQS
jgi:hypothetical protein